MSPTLSESSSFRTMACSLAPLPITKTVRTMLSSLMSINFSNDSVMASFSRIVCFRQLVWILGMQNYSSSDFSSNELDSGRKIDSLRKCNVMHY